MTFRVPRKVSLLCIVLGLACIQLAGLPHPHAMFRFVVFAVGLSAAGVGIACFLYPAGKERQS